MEGATILAALAGALIGAFIGLGFLGPAGAVIGAVIGGLFVSLWISEPKEKKQHLQPGQEQVFPLPSLVHACAPSPFSSLIGSPLPPSPSAELVLPVPTPPSPPTKPVPPVQSLQSIPSLPSSQSSLPPLHVPRAPPSSPESARVNRTFEDDHLHAPCRFETPANPSESLRFPWCGYIDFNTCEENLVEDFNVRSMEGTESVEVPVEFKVQEMDDEYSTCNSEHLVNPSGDIVVTPSPRPSPPNSIGQGLRETAFAREPTQLQTPRMTDPSKALQSDPGLIGVEFPNIGKLVLDTPSSKRSELLLQLGRHTQSIEDPLLTIARETIAVSTENPEMRDEDTAQTREGDIEEEGENRGENGDGENCTQSEEESGSNDTSTTGSKNVTNLQVPPGRQLQRQASRSSESSNLVVGIYPLMTPHDNDSQAELATLNSGQLKVTEKHSYSGSSITTDNDSKPENITETHSEPVSKVPDLKRIEQASDVPQRPAIPALAFQGIGSELKLDTPMTIIVTSDAESYLVLRQEELNITRQASTFDFVSTLGFALSVSENCLPPGLENGLIHVSCCISTSDTLEFPPDTEPVSALYHLEADFDLCESVTLTLEHCNSGKDSILVRADKPKQKFQRIEGDVEVSETCIKVDLQHFSWFAIVAFKLGRRRYCGVVYRTSIFATEEQYDVVIIRNLHALSEFTRQQMESDGSNTRKTSTFPEVTFSTGSREIALDVSVQGVTTDEGWLVYPNPHPAQITRRAVDDFSTRMAIPPKCTLQAEWKGQSTEAPQPSKYRVRIRGTTTPTSFVISIAPVRSPPVLPQLPLITREQVQLTAPEPPASPHDHVLHSGDIPSLESLLRFPGRSGSFSIPERIGVNYKSFGVFLLEDSQGEVVARLERDHPRDTLEVCSQILQMWIRGRGKKPTSWNTLIACLRDAELDTLADDIEHSL